MRQESSREDILNEKSIKFATSGSTDRYYLTDYFCHGEVTEIGMSFCLHMSIMILYQTTSL